MVPALRGHAALPLRCDGAGAGPVSNMDHIELVQMLIGHPEADLRVDLGDLLVDVRDVRYSAGRESIVLLLYPDDLRDALQRLSPRTAISTDAASS